MIVNTSEEDTILFVESINQRFNETNKNLKALHMTENLIVIEDAGEGGSIFFDIFKEGEKIYLQEYMVSNEISLN